MARGPAVPGLRPGLLAPKLFGSPSGHSPVQSMHRLPNPLQRAIAQLENFTADVIYDRRRGGLVPLYAGFLQALSHVFWCIVKVRSFLYEKRVLRNQPLGCLVVVVGNLTVGGTGKTPVVERFARALAERGSKVAVLSRGYKSRKEPLPAKAWRALTHQAPPPPKVVSDGQRLLLDSLEAGDEPYMLARNLLAHGVVVLVDKNRVKAGSYAIQHFGVDTLLLDDGLQYLPLKGHLNLVLIDKHNPFGNMAMLPRGILREPVSHLHRATHIFLTKSDGTPDPELREFVSAYAPDVDIVECAHRPQYLQSLPNAGDRLPLGALHGTRAGALSAIATPESFEAFLRHYGAEIRYSRRFLDHHRFTPDELDEFFDKAKSQHVDIVVTTEKDAVRIDPDYRPPLPFYFLRLEVEILDPGADFDEAISRLFVTRHPFKLGRRRTQDGSKASESWKA